jgi:hypothetical protein
VAKKTIISDFSALKGKVTFSEKGSDAEMPTKDRTEAAQKSKVSDVGIKVGQSIVLMDSNLRGKIIGIGKTVRIELEDGLVIESGYGEFAVTDKAEIASLKDSKVKTRQTSNATKRSVPVNPDGSLTVDLHIEAIPGGTSVPKGQQLQFQMDTFRRIIRDNANRRGLKITFIHGIGDGILKAAIRKELDEVLALRCSYSVGDPAVTIVSIR